MATTIERAGPPGPGADLEVAVGTSRLAPAERRARLAYHGVLVLFVGLATVMAVQNNSPGHWDAVANLVSARNIAEGRGFVTDIVQHLARPEVLPGPDTVRAPGIPYLAGALFVLFGAAYWIPIVLNLAVIAATSLALRQAAREAGAGMTADLLALLVLVSHRTYEMRSLWNNNALALLAAVLLLVSVRHLNGRLGGWRLVGVLGVLAGAGFLVKQTLMLGVVPLGVGLLVTDLARPVRTRIVQAAAFVALFIALAAPYWVPNLLRFGDPLYSPIQGLRLPTRYGLLGTLEYFRTVRFDAEPYTYGSIVAALGTREFVEREVARWGELTYEIVALNPFVLALAAASVALVRRANWRLYAAMTAIAIPPIFESTYWITERRYLFPVFVLLLFLVALGAREWHAWGRANVVGPLRPRAGRLVAVVGVGALLYAALPAARQWRWELIASRHPDPAWVPAVRALPDDAVVLATVPPLVTWYARNPAVIAPIGARDDLVRVVRQYRPSYYLQMDPGHPVASAPFAADDATLLARGDDWALYRVQPAAFGLP